MKRVSKRQVKKDSLNPTAFVKQDQNLAYFLGVLYADGSLYSRIHRYNTKTQGMKEVEKTYLKLDLSDEDTVRSFARYIGLQDFVRSYQQKPFRGYKRKMMYRVDTLDEELIGNLIDLGLTKDKTMNQRIPKINEGLERHFIRGLLDGDGSISSGNRVEIFTTGELTDWVSKKMFEEGYDHTVYLKYRGKSGVQLNDISLRTRNGNAIKFLDWLYQDSDNYMIRKYNRYLEQKKEHECGARQVELDPKLNLGLTLNEGEDVL